MKLTLEQKEWFKENYPKLGGTECGKILNKGYKYLNGLANQLKIKVSKNTKSRLQKNRAINQGIKNKLSREDAAKLIYITTPEQAYTLGFLWGDGYLNEGYHDLYYPFISNNYDDFIEILPILNKGYGIWKYTIRQRLNRKKQVDAYLCDGIFGQFLKDMDYDKKSLVSPTKLFKIIPNNLICYWLLGYIDADGCFYINFKNYTYQFSLAGSYEQDWECIEKILNDLHIKFKINRFKYKQNRQSHIRITNKNEILKLGNYIYNSTLGLKRKRQKFDDIKAQIL